MKNNFIGLDGFVWFIGVVEDRQDPYLIGRVRVRCFGHHTGDKTQLPTKDLPWAQVMLPVTSAGISGIGQSPIGLVEGSHVFGFFRDGEARQEPVVMGSMPGYPTELGDPTKGFYSPITGTADPHAPIDNDGNKYLTNESSHPRWKNSPDNSIHATKGDYTFNPTLSQHASTVFDNEYINNLQNIGTASVDQMNLASQFISKGTSSLFGFVADIITSNVAAALGSNIINTVGSSLSGFSTNVLSIDLPSLTDIPTIISETGEDFLKNTLGLDLRQIANSTIDTVGDANGLLEVNLLTDIDFGFDTLTSAGLQSLGIDETTGQFKYNVSNVDTIKTLVNGSASSDAINSYQSAKAKLANASRGVTPQDLVYNTPVGLVETSAIQTKVQQEANNALANVASGGLAEVQTLVGGTDVGDTAVGGILAIGGLVDDEYQDSISALGKFAGSSGILQKATLTLSGKQKLMNQFIGSNGGVADSFSVPTLPEKSDVYPYRHVYESESGHVMIYDDTPENESIIQRHRSGTQYYVSQDGTKTDIVVSDHIHAVTGSQYKVTTEDEICSIDGRCKLFINKSEVRNNHYDIVIGKGANVNIQVEKGDINMNAKDGRINMNCAEDFNIICGGEFNIISAGDFSVNSGDDITLQGDKIFLN